MESSADSYTDLLQPWKLYLGLNASSTSICKNFQPSKKLEWWSFRCVVYFGALKQFWQVNAYSSLTLIGSSLADCSIRIWVNAADEAEWHPGQQQQQQQLWEARRSAAQPQQSCNRTWRSVFQGSYWTYHCSVSFLSFRRQRSESYRHGCKCHDIVWSW